MNKNNKYNEKVERYCSEANKNVLFGVLYTDELKEKRECMSYDLCVNKENCSFYSKSEQQKY